jgi:hypothetical protein
MSAPPASVRAKPTLTPDDVIAHVQRDVQADTQLRSIPESTRDQTIARVVQDVWVTSRVNVVVPILAWRTVERTLLDGSHPTPTAAIAEADGGVRRPTDGGRERSDDRV